jgi:hypothetical protein
MVKSKFASVPKEPFLQAKSTIPTAPSHHILASYDDDFIIVYQAYKGSIAKYADENQQLSGCSDFSLSRMTWIKPNFLWMMYRSDWSRAKNQEHVLAIWIRRDIFEEQILANAVISSWSEEKVTRWPDSPYTTKTEWQQAINNSDIRLQWDPYHSPTGQKLENITRCIQLGLRNTFNRQLATNVKNTTSDDVQGWIEHVEDITEYCHEQVRRLEEGQDVELPVERLYTVANADTRKRIFLS